MPNIQYKKSNMNIINGMQAITIYKKQEKRKQGKLSFSSTKGEERQIKSLLNK